MPLLAPLLYQSVTVPCVPAVYNHWTGLVDWIGGLDWWTDIFALKITFMLSAPDSFDLASNL